MWPPKTLWLKKSPNKSDVKVLNSLANRNQFQSKSINHFIRTAINLKKKKETASVTWHIRLTDFGR